MKALIVSTRKQHVPTDDPNNEFEVIGQSNGNSIVCRKLGDFILFITPCITREDYGQKKKHNIISDLITKVNSYL